MSGISTAPMPSERTNGTGMKRRSARPTATVAPEKTTDRPAVAIVRTIASAGSSVLRSSSRKR
jgi:hypothetical protein